MTRPNLIFPSFASMYEGDSKFRMNLDDFKELNIKIMIDIPSHITDILNKNINPIISLNFIKISIGFVSIKKIKS